jgi:hypothetical protein
MTTRCGPGGTLAGAVTAGSDRPGHQTPACVLPETVFRHLPPTGRMPGSPGLWAAGGNHAWVHAWDALRLAVTRWAGGRAYDADSQL